MAAGCTAVVLPSPRSPLTTLMLNEMFAALPPGTVNTIIGGPEVGVRLTTHPGVDKVAFTGSMAVGAQIMKQAADSAKSVSLELGDKSASLILPDADLAALMPTIHFGYLANSGQSCGSTTRMIVPDSRHDEFVELSRQFIEALPVGDPWNEETVIGPLIRKEHLQSVRRRVDQAISDGAKLVASGSNSAELPGWYMEPVLLDEVANDSMVAQTELFGPVGTIIRYDGDIERGIAIANDTPYGLHAKVFTADTGLGLQVAARLRAGSVQVNGGGFRPDAPFGGMKASGIGREYGHWGMDEFSEVQHVQWVTA
jgi:acyl-CoA reductase-like NAD-dependent aldehyde dehydrogenase